MSKKAMSVMLSTAFALALLITSGGAVATAHAAGSPWVCWDFGRYVYSDGTVTKEKIPNVAPAGEAHGQKCHNSYTNVTTVDGSVQDDKWDGQKTVFWVRYSNGQYFEASTRSSTSYHWSQSSNDATIGISLVFV